MKGENPSVKVVLIDKFRFTSRYVFNRHNTRYEVDENWRISRVSKKFKLNFDMKLVLWACYRVSKQYKILLYYDACFDVDLIGPFRRDELMKQTLNKKLSINKNNCFPPDTNKQMEYFQIHHFSNKPLEKQYPL